MSRSQPHEMWTVESGEYSDHWYVHGRRRVATQAAHNPRKDPA